MPAVQADFFRKKSRNAAVQAVYKKNYKLFPSDMLLGKIPLKDKTLEVKSVEKSFPNDMSLGNLLPPWHQFLDQKIHGAHFSLGIVTGERFAIELTPSTFPQRQFARDRVPQRHVTGERVKMLLGKASNVVVSIQDSKFYIIVFSKNYASSSWCLEELVKIMECQKMAGHTAYPVFYDVEPTEVRKQNRAVGKAFAKHEKEEATGKWREALKEAADLAGFELENIANGHEAKFIQEIIEKISTQLNFINSSSDGDLIGMETRVKEVISTLQPGVGDARMLGIWGMGGAGKTTLARAIFDQISIQFDGESFIENVREVSKASLEGLRKLQKQVLSDVLKDKNIEVSSVSGGKSMMQRRMRGIK
ncbi:Toll/interleukin-1 receptor domain-containing protein, partial [Tanacetum coccineum]